MSFYFAPVAVGGNAPCARANHAACALGTRMYLFGGDDAADHVLGDLWMIDVGDGAESPVWALCAADDESHGPCARSGASLVSTPDGMLWLFGGDAGDGPDGGRCNDLWLFDTVQNRWHAIADSADYRAAEAPPPCVKHTAVVLGNFMLVYGGWDWSVCFADVYAFHFGAFLCVVCPLFILPAAG